jgi:Mg2+/Co2+ transporter CorC
VKGETIRIGDWLATVTDSDARRVLRVHLKKNDEVRMANDERMPE